MYNNYAHIVDGEIKALNIKRGGVFQGKRLGKLSPDSTYAAMELYPIVGEQPTTTETQRAIGPKYEWDILNQVVHKIYTIIDISQEEQSRALFVKLKTDFETYLYGHYGPATQGTIQLAYSHPGYDDETKNKAVDIGTWIRSVQAYYKGKKAFVLGGDVFITWDFSQFDATKPIWDFEDFV